MTNKFRWCWPEFNVYRPADKRPAATLNRYSGTVIGIAVVLFGWCWGIRWRKT